MSVQSKRVPMELPTREQVTDQNKVIFDDFTKKFGFLPNLYAVYAWSDQGFPDILTLQNRKTTLSLKEREIVNLVVSEINDCDYCRRGHSAFAVASKMFTEDEVLQIRSVDIKFDYKFKAYAEFVKDVTVNRGHAGDKAVEDFFNAGYTKANLIDTIINIGDKTISNYIHGVTKVEIDFPEVPTVTIK